MIRAIVSVAALLVAGPGVASIISPGYDGDPLDPACDFSGDDQTCWTSNDTSQPKLSDFANLLGLSTEEANALELFYKAEVGGGDGGEFADDYDTTFSNSASDPADADITHLLGGDVIGCGVCYLWVKDGNHSPALYVFDISWWDGVETLLLRNFWPRGGAISNIGIFGTAGDRTKVAEPGTLGLLGIALVGLGLVRRRRRC